MQIYNHYLGIDISKGTFDVEDQNHKHTSYTNDAKGFIKFSKTIPKDSLCVMEYTGVYYIELAKHLYKKGIAVSVENPLRIKRFMQMHLRRNKTDKADAKMIRLYGEKQEVNLWEPEPQILEQSKDLYQTMEQYIDFRSGLKNKIDGLKSKKASIKLMQMIENEISRVTISIDELQSELDDLIEKYNPEMLKNINSVKGIGKRTSTLLIMSTRGFEGFENAKQVCSYFGLAPTETKSGTSIKGKRNISKMGNPLVRKKLYMCSLQASRHNKACRELYERLLAKGKAKKLALIAVANKLLKIVFAIAKSGLPYDPEYKSYIAKKA